jgi:hypothetical protein
MRELDAHILAARLRGSIIFAHPLTYVAIRVSQETLPAASAGLGTLTIDDMRWCPLKRKTGNQVGGPGALSNQLCAMCVGNPVSTGICCLGHLPPILLSCCHTQVGTLNPIVGAVWWW